MSNDLPLSALLSHLHSESYDAIVKCLCAPPPPTSDPAQALDTHVGRSNARLLAFVYVSGLLSGDDKRKAMGALSEWVLAIRSRRTPNERLAHEVEGDLLNMAAWLREGGVDLAGELA
ncbi:MAG: hypothetical protein OXQ94_14920 [Gemmatimonadota bacterium]|nr:hypothetical protein [Gemmatimonadota bacterium]MDE2872968.1 hypothetical protein [Gemmatimonadota bacterium]